MRLKWYIMNLKSEETETNIKIANPSKNVSNKKDTWTNEEKWFVKYLHPFLVCKNFNYLTVPLPLIKKIPADTKIDYRGCRPKSPHRYIMERSFSTQKCINEGWSVFVCGWDGDIDWDIGSGEIICLSLCLTDRGVKWALKYDRLAPNGTNLGLFKTVSVHFGSTSPNLFLIPFNQVLSLNSWGDSSSQINIPKISKISGADIWKNSPKMNQMA